jgi:hypothetical protein
MAKCPKPDCNSTSFRIEQVQPENANYFLPVLVCKDCGTAIAVSTEQVLTALLEIHQKL